MVWEVCGMKRGMWYVFGMYDIWEYGRGDVQTHVCVCGMYGYIYMFP